MKRTALYLAYAKEEAPRPSPPDEESRSSVRTGEPASALGAVISESALTHWLARADAPSTDDGSFAASALQAILEAFPCAALIARSDGLVLLANSRARADLESGKLHLRRCLDGSRDTENGMVTVYPLARGTDGYERAFILRNDPAVAAAARVVRAAERWGLTPHQTEVLRMLVHGEGNKSIADRRSCSLRTVEVHMTALFKRSKTSSRAELIARFWTLG